MWTEEPAPTVATFRDRLLIHGFTEVGCSKGKITLQAPHGGRLELPRNTAGRVAPGLIERAARLLHTSTHELINDEHSDGEHTPPTQPPAAATSTTPAAKPPLGAATGSRLVAKAAAEHPGGRSSAPRRSGGGSHTAAVLTLLAATERVMDLTTIARELTDQGHPVTREQVSSACAALARDHKLIRISHGAYRITPANTPTASRLDLHLTTSPDRRPQDTDAATSPASPPALEGAGDAKAAWERCFAGVHLPMTGEVAADMAQWFTLTTRLLQSATGDRQLLAS